VIGKEGTGPFLRAVLVGRDSDAGFDSEFALVNNTAGLGGASTTENSLFAAVAAAIVSSVVGLTLSSHCHRHLSLVPGVGLAEPTGKPPAISEPSSSTSKVPSLFSSSSDTFKLPAFLV
jgi:hypothetical protein